MKAYLWGEDLDKRKFAYVKWLDASHMPGEHDLEDIPHPLFLETGGILIHHDSESVVIAHTVDEEQGSYEHAVCVPIQYVHSLKVVEVEDE